MPENQPLIDVSGVTKTYPPDVTVLYDVAFRLDAGASAAVIGPSGSGKSTLLNLIGGLDSPTSGTVTVGGQDLAGLDDVALAAFRNRTVGFIFQDHHLLPQCSVLENTLIPTLAPKSPISGKDAEARAQALLARVGLEERMDHRPAQLSGGERQRVAVVRALINSPRLLLADEPTGALDRAAAEALGDLLVELNRDDGVALLVVTHTDALAARMATVLELRDGRLQGE